MSRTSAADGECKSHLPGGEIACSRGADGVVERNVLSREFEPKRFLGAHGLFPNNRRLASGHRLGTGDRWHERELVREERLSQAANQSGNVPASGADAIVTLRRRFSERP